MGEVTLIIGVTGTGSTVTVAVDELEEGQSGFPPDELTVYVWVPMPTGEAITVDPVVVLSSDEAFQV